MRMHRYIMCCVLAAGCGGGELGEAPAEPEGGSGGVRPTPYQDGGSPRESGTGSLDPGREDAASDAKPHGTPDGMGVPEAPEPTCAEAAPPKIGPADLILWLDADQGVERAADKVTAWKDVLVPSRVAKPTSGQPRVVDDAFPGHAAIGFDGDDVLEVNAPVDGLQHMTLAMITASDGRRPGKEWCCRDDETGCSGTYHNAIHWMGTGDWGGVYLAPSQGEVALRFGTGVKTYTEGSFYDDEVFGAGGYGTCRADPKRDRMVAWTRPSSIGKSFTTTIAVKHPDRVDLHVDGAKVWSRGSAGGIAEIRRTGAVASIGTGAYGRRFAGRIALVYAVKRALGGEELATLERWLRCRLGKT